MKKKLFILALSSVMAMSLLAGCGSDETVEDVEDEEVLDEEVLDEEVVEETNDVEEADLLEIPISIVNGTDADIAELYASPAGEESWGEDLLADSEEYLESGYYMDVALVTDADTMVWDLDVVTADGQEVVWYDIDISGMDPAGFCMELLNDGENTVATLLPSLEDIQGDYTFVE